ncbi:MAG TPA: hypothetical protein VEH27_11060 [Methylomirabilota bacterium]|nr:hypothetical protein [Methylomirabilota bacterium]
MTSYPRTTRKRCFAQYMRGPKRAQKSEHAPEVARLVTIAKQALKAEAKLKSRYLAICEYIRRHQLLPRMVTEALSEAGYPKSRISEIKRVAFVSPEIWAMFKKDLIGFKPLLRRAREVDTGKTDESRQLLQWRRFLATFSAFTMDATPPENYFASNGHNLFVWHESAVKGAKDFTVGHWLVTVKRNEPKKEPKKEAPKAN